MTPYTQEAEEALKWADGGERSAAMTGMYTREQRMKVLAALVRSQAEEIAGLMDQLHQSALDTQKARHMNIEYQSRQGKAEASLAAESATVAELRAKVEALEKRP